MHTNNYQDLLWQAHSKGGEAYELTLGTTVTNYYYYYHDTIGGTTMSKHTEKQSQVKEVIVDNSVNDNSTKEVVMTNAEMLKQIQELQAKVDQLSQVRHTPNREDGMVYTIMPTLSEMAVMCSKIAPQAKCCMTGLVKLRAEKIEQGLCSSATFTFTRMEWADAAVRLGGLRTRQGADKVNKWYLDQHSSYQLLEDETKGGSLGMIQRAKLAQ